MGVRGKIEAVIYAAEEPVTLAQLAALFGEEALAELAAGELSGVMSEPGAEIPSLAGETAGNENEPAMPQTAEDLTEADAEAGSSRVSADTSQAAQEPVAAAAPPLGQQASATHSVSPPREPYLAYGEPVLFGAPDADKRAARLRYRAARDRIAAILHELVADYDAVERGMELREIAGGYQVATRPEYHDAVRAFAKSLKPPMKLTLQALETLAVIAYKQPVTAPEIAEIRGVDSGGVLGSLITRKLVTTAGRKQVVGRPILYKTTREFLLRFGLKDIAELPSMEEFEKMAGELESMSEEPEADPQASSGFADSSTNMAESEGK